MTADRVRAVVSQRGPATERRRGSMAERGRNDEMLRRQQVLADFGEFALESQDLDEVLNEACRLVGDVLGTGRAKILEIVDEGRNLFVRAGVGWDDGIVGRLRMPMNEHSSETYSIEIERPVFTKDIHTEDRFEVPAFMKRAGVVAFVNAPIFVPGKKPYGLLQVDATEPRDFTDEDTEFLRTYTIILGPVIDRLHKVRDLRSSEDRLRLVVERALDYAIFVTDGQDRILDWLPGAEAVFGWSAAEAVGRPAHILFTPEDRKAGVPEQEIETARREGAAPNVRWHLRKDGSRIFVQGSVTALRHDDGQVHCFLKMGQDVTERRAAEVALRDSEERLRSAAEVGRLGLWDWNIRTGEIHWSDEHFRMEGYEVGEVTPSYEIWAARLHPEDRADAEAALHGAMERRDEFAHEFRTVHPDGSVHWLSGRGRFFYDEEGRPVRMIGAMVETTERRAWEERQKVLVHELQHRSRNVLGVVAAIAGRTLRQGGSVQAFEERLQALSRAQALLSQQGSDTVTVNALMQAELAAYAAADSSQVRFSGPEVHLTSRQVQNFALALHELTTNAVKYGALKDEAGRLSVAWETQSDRRGRPRLALTWIESGVAIEPGAVTRRGYGTELIQEALAYALEAEIDYALGADGVRCRIEMPIL